MRAVLSETWDAVIVGSGFGGSLAARALVDAGLRVLMLERGDWVPRGPRNWAADAVGPLSPFYSTETPYRAKCLHTFATSRRRKSKACGFSYASTDCGKSIATTRSCQYSRL